MKSPVNGCACPYPKRTRVGDDAKGNRLLYCVEHGFVLIPIKVEFQPRRAKLFKIPTKAWVKKETVATKARFKEDGMEYPPPKQVGRRIERALKTEGALVVTRKGRR
jgi:hypothetical protein